MENQIEYKLKVNREFPNSIRIIEKNGKSVIYYNIINDKEKSNVQHEICRNDFINNSTPETIPPLVRIIKGFSDHSLEFAYCYLQDDISSISIKYGILKENETFSDISWKLCPSDQSGRTKEESLNIMCQIWTNLIRNDGYKLAFLEDEDMGNKIYSYVLNIENQKKSKDENDQKTSSQRRATIIYDLNQNYQLANSLDIITLEKIIKSSEEAYYNDINDSSVILDDKIYDYVKELFKLRIKDQNDENISRNGMEHVPRAKGRLLKLPIWMGSMDKVNNGTGELMVWTSKYPGPYIVTAKMDGASALYFNENGQTKLYSRGTGSEGQDITELLQYLKLPKLDPGIMIRGELILKKSIFTSKYKRIGDSTEKGKYKNSRNAVAGMVNKLGARSNGSKNSDQPLDISFIEDVEFIVYEAITEPSSNPSLQFKYLDVKFGDKVVPHAEMKVVTDESLSSIYDKCMEIMDYEIDGLVIYDDHAYERPVEKNVDYARAYKKPLQILTAITQVIEVKWKVRKYDYIKPVIIIKPIELEGVTISKATGYNAKFISDGCIGPGALIEITRAGGVIPKVINVIHPVSCGQLPEDLTYSWNDTKVDIILVHTSENKEDQASSQIKQLHSFLTNIGTKGIGETTVEKMYNIGYTTIPSLFCVQEQYLQTLGPKIAENIVTTIKKNTVDIPLPILAGSCGIFGRGMGTRKFKVLFEAYPDILISEAVRTNNIQVLTEGISKIEGFADISAKQVAEGFKPFIDFLLQLQQVGYKFNPVYQVAASKQIVTTHFLTGKNVLLTGFRDAAIKDFIESVGGKVQSSISSVTNLLIIKNETCVNNKTKAASEKGVKVITKDEFMQTYMK